MAVKYRKKPVVVEAMQFTGGAQRATPVIDWVLASGGTARYHDDDTIAIDTLEGTMSARSGWFVIRGVQGEFYPCEPEIFAQTYEPVQDS